MPAAIKITKEEYAEIKAARAENKNKNIDRRLHVLVLRFLGRSYEEIARSTGYNIGYTKLLVYTYKKVGLKEYMRVKQTSHNRKLTYEQEQKVLDECRAAADQGQVLTVEDVRKKLEEELGCETTINYPYRVLKRHGWRKVMPRSQHPKAATKEAQEASKKLTSNIRNFVYRIQESTCV